MRGSAVDVGREVKARKAQMPVRYRPDQVGLANPAARDIPGVTKLRYPRQSLPEKGIRGDRIPSLETTGKPDCSQLDDRNLFLNHPAVEQVNRAICVLGVARIMGHHADGGAVT